MRQSCTVLSTCKNFKFFSCALQPCKLELELKLCDTLSDSLSCDLPNKMNRTLPIGTINLKPGCYLSPKLPIHSHPSYFRPLDGMQPLTSHNNAQQQILIITSANLSSFPRQPLVKPLQHYFRVSCQIKHGRRILYTLCMSLEGPLRASRMFCVYGYRVHFTNFAVKTPK